MNSRVSALDRYTLVSNSDAHSPAKLGREANFFDTELSFPGLKAALKTGKKPSFLGTLEFYPEEGKYHLDGHRKCNVRLLPQQSRETGGKCPVCGRDLTLGVLYRVEELADRKETDENVPVRPFQSAIPLTEILSEILGKGPATKTVLGQYERILENAGPELLVLNDLPPEEIRKTAPPLLDEALTRMREDRVHLFPGYDGEYGVIRLFDPLELKQLKGQTAMFGKFDRAKNKEKKPDEPPAKTVVKKKKKDLVQTELFGPPPKKTDPLFQLNDDQARAVTHEGGPVLITAGPGTGKTRTLTARVAHLALNKSVDPARILAVTFTNKAAKEMRDRIAGMLAGHQGKPMPVVATFHALCLQWLSEQTDGAPARLIDEKSRGTLVADAAAGFPHVRPQDAGNRISLAKQKVLLPDEVQDPELSAVYGQYQALLDLFGVWDFDDLLARTVRLLETDPEFRRRLKQRFDHILVDEYQDLNEAQLRIMRSLMPPGQPGHNLFAIGDPDQTIYGFRGSDPAAFADFAADYPDAAIIHLTRNYRSVEAVLSASAQVISGNRPWSDESDHSSRRVYSGIPGVQTITVMEAKSAEAEAAAVARTIESLVGGTGFEAVNAGRTADGAGEGEWAFDDFAVLYRTHEQAGVLSKIFKEHGILFETAAAESVLGQKGIAQLVCLMKIIAGAGLFQDYARILSLLSRGLGKTAFRKFKKWAYEKNMDVDTALEFLRAHPAPELGTSLQRGLFAFSRALEDLRSSVGHLGCADQIKALESLPFLQPLLAENPDARQTLDYLTARALEGDDDPPAFLNRLNLTTDADVSGLRTHRVVLSTLHAAKGLEFPVVFICGCEDGYLPLESPNKTVDDQKRSAAFFTWA